MPRTSAKPTTRSRKVNRASATPTAKKKPIEQYDHKGKERVNNPPVGLVTPDTDQETAKKTYAYDPHLDPQLVWAGKAEINEADRSWLGTVAIGSGQCCKRVA